MKNEMTKSILLLILSLVILSCNQHIKNNADVSKKEGVQESTMDLKAQDEMVLSKLWTSSEFINNREHRFRSLEKAYAQPDSVINLALYSVNMESVPENIDTFKNLQLLGLGHNDLSELPQSIGNLLYLQKVHLNKNQFTRFPEVLTNNRYLKTVLISDNKIEDITPDIRKLTYLEDLVMNDNNLGTVPPHIFELRNLKVLGLRDNGIGELPDKFDQLTKLEKINLQNNNLKEIPESLIKPDLVRITLKGNPMSYAYIKELQKRMPETEIEF